MKQMEHSYKGGEKFLVNDLKTIVSKARSKAFAAVNYSLVERNWRIGKRIVEEEQNGEARAEYGKHIIEVASAALTEEFGKGFSETNIMNFKKFYLKFKELTIPQTSLRNSKSKNSRHCLMNYLRTFKKGRHRLPNSSYAFFHGHITSDLFASKTNEQGIGMQRKLSSKVGATAH